MASELDYFGIDQKPDPSFSEKIAREALPAAVGAAAALLFRKSHPMLAFLGVSALVGNAQAFARGERTLKEVAQRMGRHAVASAASLATPSHPGIAYVAGAFAADLLFDRKGDGVIDEWARYVGIDVNQKMLEDGSKGAKDSKAITVTEKK